MSTGIAVVLEDWDKENQCFIGRKYHEENEFLELQKQNVKNAQLDLEAKGKKYDISDIFRKYKGELQDDYYIKDLIPLYIESRKDEVTLGTLKNWYLYQNTWLRFATWAGYSKGILASDITIKTYKNLVFYSKKHTDKEKPKKWTDNHINKLVNFYKKVGKFAVYEELLPYNPFQEFFHPRNSKQCFVYVNNSDLLKIQNYKYYSTALEKVKDLFILQYHTGLAWVDLSQLTSESIRKGNYDDELWVSIHRQKTGTKAEVPLQEPALQVLKKYGGVDNLPKMSAQKYNFYLKEIANILGIDIKLTSHVARYTFANLALNEWGVSLEVVSAMLGHSEMRTTQRFYATVREPRTSKEMQHRTQNKGNIIKPSDLDIKKFGKGKGGKNEG